MSCSTKSTTNASKLTKRILNIDQPQIDSSNISTFDSIRLTIFSESLTNTALSKDPMHKEVVQRSIA